MKPMSLTSFFFVCSGTKILAEVDDVELDNGTKIQPLSVVFPEGNSLSVLTQEQVESQRIAVV